MNKNWFLLYIFWYDFGKGTFAGRLSDLAGDSAIFPDRGPIYGILTEIFMKSTSTWYPRSTRIRACLDLVSRGSSWGDLPSAHKIIRWLRSFYGKIAVHPGVARVTPLMIGKLIRNPPSSLQTSLKYILMTDLTPEIVCNNWPTL
jgi:hypothetical protein